jgi:predicted nuclease of predicted toxin-antitoxin system
MKFLVDMNLSPSWVDFLVCSGFEATHWSELGALDASDDELMFWAAEHGFVVLTCDLDFAAILAATHHTRPSVIQIRSDILTPEAIVVAVRQTHDELTEGAIISLDARRARLRILPLTGGSHLRNRWSRARLSPKSGYVAQMFGPA